MHCRIAYSLSGYIKCSICRLQPTVDDKPVATTLMAFSRGCSALLELMQINVSPCHSDGYHSEPETEGDGR